MRTALFTAIAASGCMGGPNLETRIGELRIVAARAEPAAVEPGDAYALELWIADPRERGGDVLTWSCLDDVPCAPVTDGIPGPVDGLTPPIVQERIATPAPVWMLACSDGDCGDLQNPDEADLRDPFTWLGTLPLAGVSAASRTAPIALDPSAIPVNPTLLEVPEIVLDRGRPEVRLAFTVTDADQAFGYATSGGFDQPAYDVDEDGTVVLTWLSAADDESGEIFVVFTQPAGGTAVWRAPVP